MKNGSKVEGVEAGKYMPMTPARALRIACLFFENEAAEADNREWQTEAREVCRTLKDLLTELEKKMTAKNGWYFTYTKSDDGKYMFRLNAPETDNSMSEDAQRRLGLKAISFAELDAERQAVELASRFREMASLFPEMVSEIIARPDVDNKTAAIENLTKEFTELVQKLLGEVGDKALGRPARQGAAAFFNDEIKTEYQKIGHYRRNGGSKR